MAEKWVFIGDSITECGRFEDPLAIGDGYVKMIQDDIQQKKEAEVINKGVGGHRVTDLAARWEEDVLRLAPDLISVSIGINDVWRQLDQPQIKQVSPEEFKDVYNKLLAETVKLEAKLFLMEPTIIEENKNSKGNQLLLPYVEIVRELATTYKATLVPTHTAFLETEKTDLTTDGVHMTEAGNQLMADTWLKAYYAAEGM
ncbi:SGNH/GDSL hydrolase family protein [Terribacillus sp. DMT04]|uniref:SGNH/GDSL hydrolase family protein n=1 Tax=Terribacillus sp. DMT04 TaxID=2850441 RepID=UPI001C2BF1B7|nr:SGNH/GDSL hydrolase family protein [Terribacillus sp. DMT04]QXE00600.1 SGNH/GDSL hydrolase family protein [Terribacillus sp. DMT04]